MATDLRAYARGAALAAGVDPELFVRQIQQESGFNPAAYNAGSGATGIAQIIRRFHPDVDPADPIASLDYAAKLMRSHADYWRGRGHTGRAVDGLALSSYNAGRQATIDGLAGKLDGWPYGETVNYLAIILPTTYDDARAILTGAPPMSLTYNPSQPPERQIADWVCSIRTAAWMLKSLGLPVDIGALQDEMSPRYVTPAVGLLDGRGYGLAEVIRAHLPADWHDRVHVFERISWDELASLAGRGPIGLGLHGANHWLNVAGKLGDGSLLDAPNPAPNWKGLGDTLTRAEFDANGPASAVWINAEGIATPPPPLVLDPRDAEIAALRQQIAERDTIIGYLTGDVAVAMQAAVDTLKRHGPAA